MKIKEGVSLYLHYIQFDRPQPVSGQTFISYNQRLKKLVKYVGEKELDTLCIQDILSIKEDLIKDKRQLSYIRVFLNTMRSFLIYLSLELKLQTLDFNLIKVPKQTKYSVKYSPLDELHKFLAGIKTNTIYGIRFMAITTTLLDTGMRISEVLSLQKEQLDWNKMCADIVGKGGRPRRVFFRPFSLNWIKKYLSLRKDSHPSLFVIHCPLPYVPKPVRYDEIERYFRLTSKRLGIHVSAHKLRRTFATYLRFNGTETKDISLMLGHENISTTERHYLGIDFNRLAESYQKHIGYGFEKTFRPTDVTWSRDGMWKECKGCGTTDKEHAAKGLCHRCYMVEKRSKQKLLT